MISIFYAEQYLEENNIPELPENIILALDQIISLEVAIFNMRNTFEPKFCDGFNIDVLISLRESKIDFFEQHSKLTYSSLNDFLD